MNHRMWQYLLIGLIGILIFTSCAREEKSGSALVGANDSDSTVAGETQDSANMPTQEITFDDADLPTRGNLVLPKLESAAGSLLVAQDNNLYWSHFDRNDPLLLADDVVPETITVDYDLMTVIYAVHTSDRTYQLYSHDLSNDRSVLLDTVQVENGTPVVRSISPDGNWVLISLAPEDDYDLMVAYLGGEIIHRFEWTSGLVNAIWLADNSLFVFARNARRPGVSGAISESFTYDPVTEVRTDLNVGPEWWRVWIAMGNEGSYSELDGFLELQSQAAPQRFPLTGDLVILPDLESVLAIEKPQAPNFVSDNNGPSLCEAWSVVHKGLRQVRLPERVAKLDDTAALSDLSLLPDGSLVLIRWYADSCLANADEALKAELVRIAPDQPADVIAEAIAPWRQPAILYRVFSDPVPPRGLYAIAPDGRYVVWIAGTTGNAIRIADLETAATGVLTESSENLVFDAVFWLPT